MNNVILYIAKHNKTSMQYFGKTTRFSSEDILDNKYIGSGKNWLEHIKEFGADISMQIYWEGLEEDVYPVASKFSNVNNIVESDIWANMIPETGLSTGPGDTTGRKWMTKKDLIKFVKSEHIETYINNGWEFGRICVDIEFIKNNYKQMSANEMSEHLDVDICTVLSKIDILELDYNKHKNKKKYIANKTYKKLKAKPTIIFDNNNKARYFIIEPFNMFIQKEKLPSSLYKSLRTGVKLFSSGSNGVKNNVYDTFKGWYAIYADIGEVYES